MTWFQALIGLIIITAALSVIMTGAWFAWRQTSNSGWVDTVWTFGLGVVGVVAALIPVGGAPTQSRQIIVAVFAAIWAARLGLHIATRTAKITDDPRYAELIKGWGKDAHLQMFFLLQKQAVVSIPLSFAMYLAAHHPVVGLTLRDWVAILIMAIAVLGEGISDWQLQQFKADPANKGGINDIGLWRYSRHPNYFFETFGWLAYPVLAIEFTGAYPMGFASILAPACMYWLLVYVSGIPPLEEHMLRSRGDKFRAYQRRTNAFFPGPVKDLS